MRIAGRVFVVLVGALLAFGPTAQALAASHQAAGQEKKAEEKAAAPAARHHVGTVKTVDAAGGSLTVAEKEGDATVSVSEKTMVKKGKESLKLSDLKAGDEVTVHYVKEGGKDIAQEVTLKAQ